MARVPAVVPVDVMRAALLRSVLALTAAAVAPGCTSSSDMWMAPRDRSGEWGTSSGAGPARYMPSTYAPRTLPARPPTRVATHVPPPPPRMQPRPTAHSPHRPLAAAPAPAAGLPSRHASPNTATPPAAVPARTVAMNGRGGSDVASLNVREAGIRDRYFDLRNVRDRNIALSSALAAWERSRSAEDAERAQSAFNGYKEARMGRFGTAVAALCLAGCSSVAAEIRSLNAEEKELAAQIQLLQDERKAIIALASALQVNEMEGTARSEAAVEKARAELARAAAKN